MAVAAVKSRRTASKEARRQQLIEATIKCISKRGIGSTTLGDVAKEAGLSQGIVNLHFKSKDNLFNETLRYLVEEYKSLAMPTYRKMCNEYDRGYDHAIEQLCKEISGQGKYENISAKNVAEILSSLTNGFWLSCLINPKSWDRHAALESVKGYLRTVFPNHY